MRYCKRGDRVDVGRCAAARLAIPFIAVLLVLAACADAEPSPSPTAGGVELSLPLDAVGNELTIYWFGERFAPGEGLPELALDSVYVPPAELPGYRASLDYQATGNAFGFVLLQQWLQADWEAGVGAQVDQSLAAFPCARREERELDIGRAVIFMAWDWEAAGMLGAAEPEDGCAAATLAAVKAVIYAGETVVLVDAPGSSSARDGYEPNPYGSREGMLILVQALRAR